MKIFTLTGPSGTGKSFRAMELAKKYNIDGIIDDGLFIYKNVVVAGDSAKKSETKIGAIRDAIFEKEEKASAVREAIKKKAPKSILVLGTSDKMADIIIKRVILDSQKKSAGKDEKLEDIIGSEKKRRDTKYAPLYDVTRIYIEDITTEEEREAAHDERTNHGKHVIPAPSMQLKKSFAGYFRDPLRVILDMDKGAASERTVVRPRFSYLGDYIITDNAISDIVKCIAKKHEGIQRIIYIGQAREPENYEIRLAVNVKKGYPVFDIAAEFQKDVHLGLEEMTAFNISFVNVEVRGIV